MDKLEKKSENKLEKKSRREKRGFTDKFMSWFREYRSSRLGGIGRFLLRLKITANVLTFFSLACGLTAAYYLFQDQVLFVVFAVLHLICDGLDGVVAREAGSTKLGKYFDAFTDSFVQFILILRIAFFLNDYYVFLTAGLFLLANVIYLYNKMNAPYLPSRTLTLILLMFNLPLFLTLAFLISGATAVYSLAKQLQWILTKI